MADEALVGGAAAFAEKAGWKDAALTLGSLRGVDRFPPFSYSPERVCSRLKIPSVPTQAAIDALAAAGFLAARQPFEEIGIKTDANYEEFVDALGSVSRAAS
jgi:tRNA G26 N,N-dimethylase Trm1